MLNVGLTQKPLDIGGHLKNGAFVAAAFGLG
jgi:hypothetical protein